MTFTSDVLGTPIQFTSFYTARTVEERELDVVAVNEFVDTGENINTDISPVLNRAIAWTCAQKGREVYLPAGQYTANSKIYLESGARLTMSPAAIITRTFSTSGLYGMITQASLSSRISDVIVRGGTLSAEEGADGNMYGLYGDDIILDHIRIDTFYGGRGIAILGDRNRVFFPDIRNPELATGVGGIRVLGGNDFLCLGGYVESGDDTFQFVPSPGDDPDLNNTDINDGRFAYCTGWSSEARLIIAAMIADEPTMTCSIRRCGFIGITGTGGPAISALFENQSSSGAIEDCFLEDITLHGDANATEAILVKGDEGYVRGLRLTGVNVIDYPGDGLVTSGLVENLDWQSGRVTSADDGKCPIKLSATTGRNSLGVGGLLHVSAPSDGPAILIGPGGDPAATCSDVRVSALIDEIADGQYGIVFGFADRCGTEGSVFKPRAGSTTAQAAQLKDDALDCYAIGNDDSALPDTDNFFAEENRGHRVADNAKDNLRVGAASIQGSVSVSSTQTLTQRALNHIVRATAGSSAINLTLPTTPSEGDQIQILKADSGAGAVNVKVSGTTVTVLYTQNDRVTMQWNGAAWEATQSRIAPHQIAYNGAQTVNYTVTPGANRVTFRLHGGGGGGGSGRRGLTTSNRTGGGGGGGGSVAIGEYPASALTSAVTILIGAGGTGGAAVTTNDTDGNAGTDGGYSRFGQTTDAWYRRALGGNGGSAGAVATATGGAGASLDRTSGNGGASTVTGGSPGIRANMPGGGGGGGLNTSNTGTAGGNGIDYDSTTIVGGTAGNNGTNGGTPPSATGLSGSSSGSGGGSGGGNGGNGGGYGGAGGGGGASSNGTNSGKGGNGTDGACLIVEYFD